MKSWQESGLTDFQVFNMFRIFSFFIQITFLCEIFPSRGNSTGQGILVKLLKNLGVLTGKVASYKRHNISILYRNYSQKHPIRVQITKSASTDAEIPYYGLITFRVYYTEVILKNLQSEFRLPRQPVLRQRSHIIAGSPSRYTCNTLEEFMCTYW